MIPQFSSLGSFLAFAGAAGVISALLTQGLTSLRERFSSRREAKYLALRIAVILETFADDCISIISDADTSRQSEGAAGQHTTNLAALAPYPDDEKGWRALGSAFSAEALGFPNLVRAYQQSINFTWQVADPDDAQSECEEASAVLGHRAWALAKSLRLNHGFPPFAPKYDLEAALEREMRELKDRQAQLARAPNLL